MKTRLLPLVVFALIAAACGSMTGPDDDAAGLAPQEKSASEIIGGVNDTTGHPAVVLIQHNSGFLCTGTVIGPSVVLTAGHCTVLNEACTLGNCVTRAPNGYTISAGFDPGGAGGPDWFFGAGAGAVGTIVSVHTNPAYNSVGGLTFLEGDTSVIILGNVAPVTPMPWNAANAAVYTSGQAVT